MNAVEYTLVSDEIEPSIVAEKAPPIASYRRNHHSTAAAGDPVGGTIKRLFDIVFASAALVVLSPVLGILALAVKLQDGGPAFFGHTRIGRHGVPFRCLKLRSMVLNADERLAALLAKDPVAAAEWEASRKLKVDPRVTALGRFLRKSSLDELPQLLNIIRGEMSIVGPRPVVEAELELYGEARAAYLALRPGLTGPWQVSGRNDVSYQARVDHDVFYAANWSLPGDMLIVARTIPAVLRARGTY